MGPNNNWTTFDEFKVENSKLNYVKYANPITNNSYCERVCNCGSFLKKYICEHILGIGLRMKFDVAMITLENKSQLCLCIRGLNK